MREPVLITTPIPTPEELADELGVSRRHLGQIRSVLRKQGLLNPVAAPVSKKGAAQARKIVARKALLSQKVG